MSSPASLWQTFYVTEQAEFCQMENANSISPLSETWQPAKVYISAITDNRRWLMVVLHHGAPVIFRAIEEGWMLSCDEYFRHTSYLDTADN
ncbi:hypothetical protein TRAPUB_13792 [Trametes pubescens]|uniref:Uncharacterized protein n=1 Tax=Trametes pubescens TaxID=154538 RepID=A0A1M2VQ47_TRAPU|nr:hypothetical protein TRAPUB_13792 [Trametes pubescens]